MIVSVLVLFVAACGGSDEEADTASDDAAPAATAPSATAAATATTTAPEAPATAATEPDSDDGPAAPGPGDAVGTLTGPDLDILVAGQCDYDVSDLTSADIAFADVRGVDPSGVEIPARFGLSGSSDRNTQLNIDGTAVVVRWSEPGLLEQSTDEGSYQLETTIGRLVVTTADGYALDISCFER